MSDKTNGATEMGQAEAEALHEMLVAVETRLTGIAEIHPAAFASALFALATYTVEKVYVCSTDIEKAALMLARAQEQGLDNFMAIAEAERNVQPESKIITPD